MSSSKLLIYVKLYKTVKMKQFIAFNRKKVLCESKTVQALDLERANLLISFLQEFRRFGIKFSDEVIKYISKDEMADFVKDNLPVLIKKYHEDYHLKFKPLYPGFPSQVASQSEEELVKFQSMIYETLDYDSIIFDTTVETSDENILKREPETFNLMTKEEFLQIPETICKAGVSLTDQVKEELSYFLTSEQGYQLPENIPFKETLVFVMRILKDKYSPKDFTDILRFAVSLLRADGSSELVSKDYTTIPLSRENRRTILSLIDQMALKKGVSSCVIEAKSKRFVGPWMLVIRKLHIGDYAKRYPKAAEFIKSFSEERKKFRTWASTIQNMYRSESIDKIATAVSVRPGEFLRRFDSILRRYLDEKRDTNDLLNLLSSLSDVKNKTLIELLNYYSRRDKVTERLFKSRKTGCVNIVDGLEPLSSDLVVKIKDILEKKFLANISNKYKGDELKGQTVVLDPHLSEVPVPLNMRGSETVPTASSFEIPESVKFLRFFCHWIQEDDKEEDIDLHGVCLSEDLTQSVAIGWNSFHNHENGKYSGDVRHRDGGCSEYIDIDVEASRSRGWRYIVMNVNNYENRGLNTLPCWFGYEYLVGWEKASLDWNPKNPQFIATSESPNPSVFCWLFDLVDRKAYFINMPTNNNVPDKNELKHIVHFLLNGEWVNSLTVLENSFKAQGAQVLNTVPQEVDEEGNIIPFDGKIITKADVLADYMIVAEAAAVCD